MLIGTTTYPDPNDALPLTFAIEFYPDGEYGGLNSVTDCEGNEYGLEQATGIFYALPAAVREQIESECLDAARRALVLAELERCERLGVEPGINHMRLVSERRMGS